MRKDLLISLLLVNIMLFGCTTSKHIDRRVNKHFYLKVNSSDQNDTLIIDGAFIISKKSDTIELLKPQSNIYGFSKTNIEDSIITNTIVFNIKNNHIKIPIGSWLIEAYDFAVLNIDVDKLKADCYVGYIICGDKRYIYKSNSNCNSILYELTVLGLIYDSSKKILTTGDQDLDKLILK